MDNNYNGYNHLDNDNQNNSNDIRTDDISEPNVSAGPQSNFNSQINGQTSQSSQPENGTTGSDSQPIHNVYSPSYSGYYYPPQKPVKPKKEKNRYPLSVLIACCLICSLLAGAVSAGAMILSGNFLNESNNGGSGSTVINVDKSSTDAVSAVAEKAVPSVVGIRVTASVSTFFGLSQEASSEGSGVIYKSDGYIITNYHVISAAVEAKNKSEAEISVYLPSDLETAIKAEVVGYDSASDLAVIKIDRTGLDTMEIADSDEVQVGEMAVAVGNPGGLEYMGSVSSGIVSGLNRTIKLEGISEMKLIQTDAAINPGNSGGALVSSEGKLIGINSSKISDTNYEGMGFAIPSNYVVKVCDNIINNKDVKYAYVGITISTEYSAEILKSMGYPAGAVVESVESGSPADNAGIRTADIIISFNGVAISDYIGYNKERLNHKPNEKVTLNVYRGGRYYDVSLTLGESNS